MRRRSNQRITKIKKDVIEELLKRAEGTDVESATSIQPPGSDLTPYPDMNNLRLWIRDYLLKGMNKTFPVKINTDGQTYLTTIVDGLPLFTKMSKTIVSKEYSEVPDRLSTFVTKVGSLNISDDFVASGFSNPNYFTIPTSDLYRGIGIEYYIKFTTYQQLNTERQGLRDCGLCASLDVYNDEIQVIGANGSSTAFKGLKPSTTYWIKCSHPTSTTFKLSISTDGILYTDLPEVTNVFTFNYTNATKYGQRTGIFRGTIDLKGCKIVHTDGTESTFLHYNTVESDVPVETSKPGLWLSNLVAPVSESNAGSWLRHNLIHSNHDTYSTINSDIIGNYSYSFLQRALIYEGELPESGGSGGSGGSVPIIPGGGPIIAPIPLPNASDSFCLHWSPSALSCLAIPSLSISNERLNPNPNVTDFRFGNTYTNYQTLVVPADPDMQQYETDVSKFAQFQFTKNDNSIPLNKTWYAARAVGNDWTYDLQFTPNGNGSGNDYGSGSGDGTGPNGSNGACVTGTITYTDSILGTTCTQEVNSCFQTTQSYFNPEVPDFPENRPLVDPGVETFTIFGHADGCTGIDCSTNSPFPNNTTVSAIITNVKPTGCGQECGWDVAFYDNYNTTDKTPYKAVTGGLFIGTYCYNCGIGRTYKDISIDSYSLNYGKQYNCCGSYNDVLRGTFEIAITNKPVDQPETGVDIYMNITDLKAQYESEGLPWPGGCGEDRFTFSFSTEPCQQSYCTAKLVATNVDINALGDISQLNKQNLKG